MGWRRLGLVYAPSGVLPWARSHAALPTPLHLQGDLFRFFFSARDADNRSHVGWADVEISDTPHLVAQAQTPVLAPGEDGAFDDSGVSVCCIVPVGTRLRMYYLGWNLGMRSSWRNAIGMAEATTPDGPFVRYSAGPILDRSPEDPYTLSYPFVLCDGGNKWRMWYGSSVSPARGNIGMRYALKHAWSADGVVWMRDGVPVVDSSSPDEYAIARASVVMVDKTYLMMLTYRGDRYKIGAAASHDGYVWWRIDEQMGLLPASDGWDDETSYGSLFYHKHRLWMAYCGSGYGQSGFGLAVWEGELKIDE